MLAANCPPHTAQPLAHAFSLSVSGTCRIGRCSPWATPFPPPPPPKVAPVQQLHRYCCVVRLLQNVHIRRAALAFADRSRPSWGRENPREAHVVLAARP